MSNKTNGVFYTPKILSDFIVDRIFYEYNGLDQELKILEPSCGDGVFLDSLVNNELSYKNRSEKGNPLINKKAIITLIEKDTAVTKVLSSNITSYYYKNVDIKLVNDDYLNFHFRDKKNYDLILANPPYIKKEYLSDRQIELCEMIHKEINLDKKRIQNIWTAFLLSGILKLTKEGIMAFVIPCELLQIQHTEPIRNLLSEHFEKIEIFAFNEIIFEGLQQDTIAIICYKKAINTKKPGVSFYQVDKLEDLKEPDFTTKNTNIHRTELKKWTNYLLTEEELNYLTRLTKEFKKIRIYCTAQVGVVTAANDFFIFNEEVKQKFELDACTLPIIQKISLLKRKLIIEDEDVEKIKANNKPCNLLNLEGMQFKDFPKLLKEYLKFGESKEIHNRYKCKLRNNWYDVPSTWVSDLLFIKRCDIYPRIIVNNTNSTVTDSFYRIKLNEGLDKQSFAFSFYNSLTFIFSELEGRYYGGGVLELTPNEFKDLPIPYIRVKKNDFSKLNKLLLRNAPVIEILNFTDKIILKDNLGFSDRDIEKLHKLYDRLLSRRINRHKYKSI
ncbi:N-6 DNA methylase [Candidatus Dojkabacteria bacterium]|nr:N-6 DNA methylase [Candidatus Dojkabacteria bacterium]